MGDDTPEAVEPARVAPNRLSADAGSPYYDREALAGLTVRNGSRVLKGVVEYSMSGKWAKIHLLDGRGQPKRERGRVQIITVFGPIVASYDEPEGN